MCVIREVRSSPCKISYAFCTTTVIINKKNRFFLLPNFIFHVTIPRQPLKKEYKNTFLSIVNGQFFYAFPTCFVFSFVLKFWYVITEI